MLLIIPGVLDATDLAEILDVVGRLDWKDGAETAGSTARAVKRNWQADLSRGEGAALQHRLQSAVSRNDVISTAAITKRTTPVLISRTETNGGYGLHTDNAWIGQGERAVRTDLSYTLFLSKPNSYEGGELVIEMAGLTEAIKLSAGDLVLYPSNSLHRVADVTSGERYAAIGWIESRVQDAGAREILFELANLQATLSASHDKQSLELLTLAKVRNALLKRWSAGG
jgi:PKHD-type hydroxylase